VCIMLKIVNIKKIVLLLMFFMIILTISSISQVNAVPVTNLGTVDSYNNHAIVLNNDNSPKFVKKPKVYGSSFYLAKTKGFETKKNTITTKIGNKKYTFKTEYFLPLSWKKYNDWYNVQSISITGRYMYTLISLENNKGFIVRYDLKILNKLKANGKNLAILRKLGANNRDKNLSTAQILLKKTIKVGPVFNVGHGQSMTYNFKGKTLWMLQDDNPESNILKIMRINMITLKPDKIYKFQLNYKNYHVRNIHNLAFDTNGNFYMDHVITGKSSPLGADMIFTGKINGNKLDIKLLAIIKNRPGEFQQSLAINPITNRLYLVSDGAIYTMPVNKLLKGTLTKKDIYYSVFNTKREFEGISFDKYGRNYLLVLRGSEVLKSKER
jgi:hypothetical protein